MPLKDTLRNNWPAVTIAVIAVAIVVAAIAIIRTMPPRTIVMATGSEGGAYARVGERYREVLARAGVEVRLVPTAGSPENLALLLDRRSGVSVGLLQGGTPGAEAASTLESLGTLFYEPMWLFYKRGLPNTGVAGDLKGRRISVGPVGSGTRALALELLKRNGIDGQVSEFLDLMPQAAGEKLLSGEIDAMLTVNAWDAPIVRQLLADESIALASFPRADAYVALYPFLDKVVVPRGVGDLAKDLPPADVILFAPKASLIVHKDLHPAIQYLLLNAAAQIHSKQAVFQNANQFPAAEAVDIPLSSEAMQFYKSGRPYLHNHLPFWAADLFGKLLVLLIPILGVLYPILRTVPPLYDWVMRSKIARIYGELRFLEDEIIEARRARGDTGAMVARLDRLEGQANQLRIPVAYASMLYILRNHIDVVRGRLQK
jgi:TRAP transporter TAXI family solute receptor